MTSGPFKRLLFGDEPIRRDLDRILKTVRDAWAEVALAVPDERSRELVYVDVELADHHRRRPPRRFHFFFGRPGASGAYHARVDNVGGELAVSETYRWPAAPGLPGFDPLDPDQVQVELAEALQLADEGLGPPLSEAEPPDLEIAVGLRSPEGGPVWELRYDYWLPDGTGRAPTVLVDARTGRVTLLE